MYKKLLLAATLGTQESESLLSQRNIYFLISTLEDCHELVRDIGLYLAEL